MDYKTPYSSPNLIGSSGLATGFRLFRPVMSVKSTSIFNDIDCILIFIRQGQIKNDPTISPILHLIDADINVINMTAKRQKENGSLSEEDMILVRSPYNDRKRPNKTSKINGSQFNITQSIKEKVQALNKSTEKVTSLITKLLAERKIFGTKFLFDGIDYLATIERE